MNGTYLRELRLFRQMSPETALGQCPTATESADQWRAIEASDAKVPAAIERVWGLVRLPRSVRSFSSTTTTV